MPAAFWERFYVTKRKQRAKSIPFGGAGRDFLEISGGFPWFFGALKGFLGFSWCFFFFDF